MKLGRHSCTAVMLLSQCEARQAQLYCSDAAVSHSVKLGRHSCTAVMLLSQCEARQAQLYCSDAVSVTV